MQEISSEIKDTESYSLCLFAPRLASLCLALPCFASSLFTYLSIKFFYFCCIIVRLILLYKSCNCQLDNKIVKKKKSLVILLEKIKVSLEINYFCVTLLPFIKFDVGAKLKGIYHSGSRLLI